MARRSLRKYSPLSIRHFLLLVRDIIITINLRFPSNLKKHMTHTKTGALRSFVTHQYLYLKTKNCVILHRNENIKIPPIHAPA